MKLQPRPRLRRPPPLNPVRKRPRRYVAESGSNLLVDLLTLPVLGAPRMVHWLARKTMEEAQQEFLDGGRVRGELLELQQQLDAEDIDEAEYDRQEQALLERLKAIREFQVQRSGA